MSALDNTASHHTVTYFPTDIKNARQQVDRYALEAARSKSYIAALNLQVITRHYDKLRSPRLAAIGGTNVQRHPESTEFSAPVEWG